MTFGSPGRQGRRPAWQLQLLALLALWPGHASAGAPRAECADADDGACPAAAGHRRTAAELAERRSWRASVLLQVANTRGSKAVGHEDLEDEGDHFPRLPSPVGRGIPRDMRGRHSGGFAHTSKALPADVKGKLKCREPVNAMQVTPYQNCPDECPFWLHDLSDNVSTCLFQCVRSQDCGALDPNASVSDPEGMFCRPCRVEGCKTCFGHGTDKCSACRLGYVLANGRCLSKYRQLWRGVYTLALLLLVLFLLYYLHLVSRPTVNEVGLRQGLRFRARTRLRPLGQEAAAVTRTRTSADGPALFPLSTNLLTFHSAGPSLPLFFRFQLFIIVWASAIAIGWVLVSILTDLSLLTMGLHTASTPRLVCYIINWGHRMQLSLSAVKQRFLLAVYLATFFGALLHATLQLRSFEEMDRHATMKDYAALCSGVPEEWQGADAESQLQDALEQSSGIRPIGVSICWDYGRRAEDIQKLTRRETEKAQRLRNFSVHTRTFAGRRAAVASGACDPMWPLSLLFTRVNAALGFEDEKERRPPRSAPRSPTARGGGASPSNAAAAGGAGNSSPRWESQASSAWSSEQQPEDAERDDKDERREEVKELITSLRHTGKAFAIFETEALRDDAVAAVGQRSWVASSGLSLMRMEVEPDSVNWKNFSISNSQAAFRTFLGVLVVLAGLIVWIAFFYFPYAYYQISFSLAVGEPPGFFSSLTFSTLVLIGNQFMYMLCHRVASACGFDHKETEQQVYIVLYLGACVINVSLDMIVTYFTTYYALVSTARTFDGRRLETLGHMELWDSYPMQRMMGGMLFRYAFPSCFLLPYLFEPLIASIVPNHIAELLVRSHKNVVGFAAERALAFQHEFDFGRYADLSLNMIIAAMMLFFPGGYVLPTFAALALCHVGVYALDAWRVLRALPGFNLASIKVDRTATGMLSIPCGMIAAAAVIKAQASLKDLIPGVTSESRELAATVAFFAHLLAHWLLLAYAVPLLAPPYRQAEMKYGDMAREVPCSYFSANPVHCLRSQYIHGHSPPWCYYVRGKEHLIMSNPKIGNYYEGLCAVRSGDDAALESSSEGPASDADDTFDGTRRVRRNITTKF